METAVERKCKIDQCKGRYRAKGYCTRHYRKWRQGAYSKIRYKCCTQENCRKPMGLNGLCEEHYKAFVEAGKPKEAQAPASKAAASEAVAPEKEEPRKEAEKVETDKEDQK